MSAPSQQQAQQEATVRGALEGLLRSAGQHNRNDMVAPVAILWTDAAKSWTPVIASLRTSLPILTLGDYRPDALTGPAIWLRCVVDGTLPEVALPGGVPILYLPEVSRNDLRAIESCPKQLRPLAELQYRGVFFTQPNHRDWTPAAFLAQSKIKVAEDQATKAALQRALPRLLSEPLSALQPLSPISADALNTLLTPDPVQQLLVWLDDPTGTQRSLEALHDGSWASFIDVAKGRYGFDPVQDGELTAARLLGDPQGSRAATWKAVWARFAESPQRYPNLPSLLRRAKPPQTELFNTSPTWPQDNEDEEKRLRTALLALKDKLPTDAAREVRKLEPLKMRLASKKVGAKQPLELLARDLIRYKVAGAIDLDPFDIEIDVEMPLPSDKIGESESRAREVQAGAMSGQQAARLRGEDPVQYMSERRAELELAEEAKAKFAPKPAAPKSPIIKRA